MQLCTIYSILSKIYNIYYIKNYILNIYLYNSQNNSIKNYVSEEKKHYCKFKIHCPIGPIVHGQWPLVVSYRSQGVNLQPCFSLCLIYEHYNCPFCLMGYFQKL